jgi:outer membrane protein TolC
LQKEIEIRQDLLAQVAEVERGGRAVTEAEMEAKRAESEWMSEISSRIVDDGKQLQAIEEELIKAEERNRLSRITAPRQEASAYEFYGRRADELLKAAKGRNFPKITLSGNLGTTGGDYYNGGQEDMYVQLGLQWTLFDGGAAKAEAERLKVSARELSRELENLNAQIRQVVTHAELRLNSAKKRFQIARNQAEDAREDYCLALGRYDAQVGMNLDVVDSRAALTESRGALVNAVYDIAAARCGMIFAVGEDVPGEGMFE